ncbi:MAG: hypothetical protein K0R78_2686 [Pelosinus sp.]|nr:hypothetical protein [Pelosinus sp.]
MHLLKYPLFVIVILSYYIGSYLPITWGWENGLLEWSQVILLAAGALLTSYWWQEAKSSKNFRHASFFAWVMPLWLLMIGRELSWGRVFYPAGLDPVDGPYFISVAQLPYGKIVYPVIAIIIFAWFLAVVKYKLYVIPYELYRQGRFPTGEFILVVFSFAVAYIAEKHFHNAIMEELVECIAYFSLILTAYRAKVALQQRSTIILPHRFL